MGTRRPALAMLRDDLLTGAWLGVLVLGVGGRLVMRGIAMLTDAPSAISVGGTVTVIAAGTAAGIGGALWHAMSRTMASLGAGPRPALHIALFATGLAFVTARGLHGSPAAPAAAFWPLVVAYAFLLDRVVARRRRPILHTS